MLTIMGAFPLKDQDGGEGCGSERTDFILKPLKGRGLKESV
jgi:hypothetical protein